jgi:MarR family transcriptional regulator, organic hydroperoxide resistance regulator
MSSATKSAPKGKAAGEQREVARRVWSLMHEVFMASRPQFMALCREYDLFPPQVLAIRHLEQPKSMRQIADLLACDSSNVTGIIDRLEERDLVRRTAAEHDRRVKLLVLTPEGERLRKEMAARLAVPPGPVAELPLLDLLTLEDILQNVHAAQQSERGDS